MLDKFRNDYIIHFYGAILMPNKTALITEYAPYGSCEDLMLNESFNQPDLSFKIKLLSDD